MIRVGAVTPTRNNRPRLLERCQYYLHRQTHPVILHDIVDYPQKTHPHDITERYMYGLKRLKDHVDVVFLIEDDDYYAPHYVETMLNRWAQFGKPLTFGVGETYFYHFPSQFYWHREHPERACAYSTMVTSEVVDKINPTSASYTQLLFDMGIWRQFPNPTCQVWPPITIGMKHGFGVCGAAGHNEWFYNHDKRSIKDQDYKWLRAQIGEEDTEWYIKTAMERKA